MKIYNGLGTLTLAAICLVYICVRFWNLTSSCLWFDEIFSVHAAGHSWNSLFWFVALDVIHPPLFYVLLKLWISIGGESLFWLRFFPVFFSIIALIPFILFCRELKLKFWTIAFGMSLFAVNGSLIKYAQEVRMYSLLLCLSLFSMWLFARFFSRGKSFWLLTLINILLVYTHYFGWLVVLSEVAAILILQRIKIRRILLMFALAFASFLPWIVTVAQAANIGADVKQNIGWIAKPGISSIFEFVFDVIEPFYYQQSSAEPTSIFTITVPILLLIAAAKISFYLNRKGADEKSSSYLLAVFSALPVIAAFIASWLLPVSVWGSRHLIIVFAPMILLSALFITQIKWKIVRIAVLCIAFLLTAIAFSNRVRTEQPEYIWCAWEKLATEWIYAPHLSAEPKTLYVFEDLVGYHFWFSVRDLENYRVKVVKGMEGVQEDTAYFLPRGFERVEKVTSAEIGGDMFWIAFRDVKPENPFTRIPFITEQKPPLSTLAARGFIPEDVKKFDSGNQTAFLILMRKDAPYATVP